MFLKTNTKNNRQLFGFTLIETLLAVGIFSVLMVTISGIYLHVTGLQKNTANFQRLQSVGRYMLEKMAREIRGRELDLSATFAGGSNPVGGLVFYSDEYGEKVSFAFEPAALRQGQSVGSLIYRVDNEEDFLNAADVEVLALQFFVLPVVENYWGEGTVTNFQPRVTIALKIKNRGLNAKYIKTLDLQTTISGKIYNR